MWSNGEAHAPSPPPGRELQRAGKIRACWGCLEEFETDEARHATCEQRGGSGCAPTGGPCRPARGGGAAPTPPCRHQETASPSSTGPTSRLTHARRVSDVVWGPLRRPRSNQECGVATDGKSGTRAAEVRRCRCARCRPDPRPCSCRLSEWRNLVVDVATPIKDAAKRELANLHKFRAGLAWTPAMRTAPPPRPMSTQTARPTRLNNSQP